MTFDTAVKVVARKAPLGKWVVLALLQLQGGPASAECPKPSIVLCQVLFSRSQVEKQEDSLFRKVEPAIEGNERGLGWTNR